MPSVAIVAGEASGDASGAALALELRNLCPEIEIWGAGGHGMRDAGVRIVADFSWAGAIGIVESLRLVPRLLGEQKRLKRELVARRPDVFVPIDFGAFNVPLGKFARSEGIKTVYYFPPGSWRRRAKDSSNLVAASDKIITPFPWSETNLRDQGADAQFYGHPMLDRVAAKMTESDYRGVLGVSGDAPLVGFLPGSRTHEIDNIMPVMIGAAEMIANVIPNAGPFVIGAGSERAAERIGRVMRRAKAPNGMFRVVREMTYEVMAHSDLVVTCSGTATLESMILGTPMVIVYRGSKLMKLEYLFRKSILEDFIGMPNIIAGRSICPELLAEQASREGIAKTAISLLSDHAALSQMKEDLRSSLRVLGEPGATRSAAQAVLRAISPSLLG